MSETYPRILARRADGALLVALDASIGCVYDPRQRRVYPRFALVSLLNQPYWRRYHGDGAELRDWPGPPPPLPTFPYPPQQQQKETPTNDDHQ